MRLDPNDDRHHIAAHEAAHAVAYYRLGVPLALVSIRLLGETAGRTCPKPGADVARDDDGVVTYAGCVAEQVMFGWVRGPAMQEIHSLQIGRAFGGSDPEDDRYFGGARELVTRYRPVIERLAEELLVHEEIGGAEAEDVIRRAMET